MPALLRLLPMALAIVVLVGVAFLPWIDSGSADFAKALAGRPGYEGTAADLGLAPIPGTKTLLGPYVGAAAGVAWLATLAAHLYARRGEIVRARQGIAAAFAAFLIAAILALTTLLRGPGEPIPTRVGILLTPRFDVGVWVSLVGSALGAVACGVVVTKTKLPVARAPRGARRPTS